MGANDRTRASRRGPLVAIDGPAGSGKSTLARALATDRGLPYVNTGLMYRAVAYAALTHGVDPDDERALEELARELRFGLTKATPAELLVDGRPPPPALTSEVVEEIVSRVARHPAVRDVLRRAQRELGAGGAVMEGRDIGTIVFPDADVKIFLSARRDVRGARRRIERGGRHGVEEALRRRDRQDAVTNPLAPAPDAHVLDTTALSPDEVLEEARRLVRDLTVTDRRLRPSERPR